MVSVCNIHCTIRKNGTAVSAGLQNPWGSEVWGSTLGDGLNSTLGDLVFTAFNVLPKDLKRQSRGVSNFEYTRNRILWATREQTSMLAVPRCREDVPTFTGKKRGPYRKQNREQENSLDK